MNAMSPHSLDQWKSTLIDYVRSGEPDLTNRQMALMLLVYLDPGPHTVRGLARALSWWTVGAPSLGHKLGLVMELVIVPLLMLWQARVARRANRTSTAR